MRVPLAWLVGQQLPQVELGKVLELAVHPIARRDGLGRRLLNALIDDRPAWLLTVPTVAGTTAFYDAAGRWRQGTGQGITLYTNVPIAVNH